MKTYRARQTAPVFGQWFEVKGESPQEAIQQYHLDGACWVPSLVLWRPLEGGQKERLLFASFEVEGQTYVSRISKSGIWRLRGTRPAGTPTPEDVARELGWKHRPDELLDAWEGEESFEKAQVRHDTTVRNEFGGRVRA